MTGQHVDDYYISGKFCLFCFCCELGLLLQVAACYAEYSTNEKLRKTEWMAKRDCLSYQKLQFVDVKKATQKMYWNICDC